MKSNIIDESKHTANFGQLSSKDTCPRCLDTCRPDGYCESCKDRETFFPQTPAQKKLIRRVIAFTQLLQETRERKNDPYSCYAEGPVVHMCLGRVKHAATMCFDTQHRSKIDLKIMRDATAIMDAFDQCADHLRRP